MSAFAAAVGVLFADANLARDIVYTAEGGASSLVRAILRRPDDVTGFGEARIWSETTRLDLRLSEVTNPRPGDRIEIDGEAFLVQGEPVRDRERLVWTMDLRPACAARRPEGAAFHQEHGRRERGRLAPVPR